MRGGGGKRGGLSTMALVTRVRVRGLFFGGIFLALRRTRRPNAKVSYRARATHNKVNPFFHFHFHSTFLLTLTLLAFSF